MRRTVEFIGPFVPGVPAEGEPAVPGYVLGRKLYVLGRKLAASSLLVQVEAFANVSYNRHVVMTMLQRTQDTEHAAWFARLATVTAPLNHGCIPRQLDAGETGGRPFVVTPAFPGEDLVRVIGRRGPLPVQEVARIIQGIASALDYAYWMGVVHGDLHPRRVLLAAHGRVMLTGLGEFPPPGGLIGNLHHLAPEQLVSVESRSRASDVYALAEIAFFLLSGRFAFEGGSLDWQHAKHHGLVPSVAERGKELAAAVDPVLRQALAPLPASRAFMDNPDGGEPWDQGARGFAWALTAALQIGSGASAARPRGWAWDYECGSCVAVLTDPASEFEEVRESTVQLGQAIRSESPEDARMLVQPLLSAIPRLVANLYCCNDLTLLEETIELLLAIGAPCFDALRQALQQGKFRLYGVLKALTRCCGGIEDVTNVMLHHPDRWERKDAALCYIEWLHQLDFETQEEGIKPLLAAAARDEAVREALGCATHFSRSTTVSLSITVWKACRFGRRDSTDIRAMAAHWLRFFDLDDRYDRNVAALEYLVRSDPEERVRTAASESLEVLRKKRHESS